MELKYSTGLKRIGAAIVDNLVFLPLTFLSEKLYALELPREGLMAWNYVFVVLPVAYSIICHYKYGMTIGKYVAKIKVIDVSETKNMNLRQAFLRDIFLVIMMLVDILIANLEYYYWIDGEYPEYIHWITIISGSAALLWTLLEIISMLANSKRRAIHDFIAGTVVVRTDVFERSKLISESFNNDVLKT